MPIPTRLAPLRSGLTLKLVSQQQEQFERCVCDDRAVAGCASCGRARCSFHLSRGLCLRCTEALRREMDARTVGRLTASGGVGVAVTLGFLALHTVAGILVGIPCTIATFLALRWYQRRRLIAKMGPRLAASQGELPPLPRDLDPTSGHNRFRSLHGVP